MIAVVAIANQTGRRDFVMQAGDIVEANGITMSFESPSSNAVVNFTLKDGFLFVTANDSITELAMMGQPPVIIAPDSAIAVNTQKAYSMGNSSFAVKQYMSKGVTQLVYAPAENNQTSIDAVQTEITVGDTKRTLNVFGIKGEIGEPSTTRIDGIDISVSYGSKIIEIPFSIHYTDFQFDR